MKPGWRIFLRILTLGLGFGAKAAKRPGVAKGLESGRDLIEELDQSNLVDEPVTPPASPRAKHRGLK